VKVVVETPLYDGSPPFDRWKQIKDFVKEQDVKLVIFPEGYAEGPKRHILQITQKIAKEVGVASLMGYSVKNHPKGPRTFETSGYYNPYPKPGETESCIYVRHCHTYPAWDWPGYQGKEDPMYQPFVVGGKRFGVQHCQDIYYPRVTMAMIKNGAEIQIGLSSDNLKVHKWLTVVKGRSIENRCTIIQAAGKDPNHYGKHSVIAYRNGEMLPLWVPEGLLLTEFNPYNLPPAPVFVMVDIDGSTVPEPVRKTQAKGYWDDITLSLGRRGTGADIQLNRREGYITHNGKPLKTKKWNMINHEKGKIAVLPLPGSTINKPARILDSSDADHHLVIYMTNGAGKLKPEEVKGLIEMRAVENWLAVFAWQEKLGAKPSMMRGLQRLVEKEGKFGFDCHNMPGSRRVFPKDISNDRNAGLKGYLKEKYEELGK
jgi:predicted amidohydrolase